MRDKLNESKAAQAGLILVLAAVAAFMLLGKGGGEGAEAASGEEAVVSSEEAPITAETVSAETGGGAGASVIPSSLPDTKAPPAAFRAAYESDRPVVLLLVHDDGIDDRYARRALDEVASIEHVATFVVPAKKIPEYASVTLGLNVSQLPTMILLRPRNLSHGIPQASVLTGYQTPESVYQAIRDASYAGPENSTYHPG